MGFGSRKMKESVGFSAWVDSVVGSSMDSVKDSSVLDSVLEVCWVVGLG